MFPSCAHIQAVFSPLFTEAGAYSLHLPRPAPVRIGTFPKEIPQRCIPTPGHLCTILKHKILLIPTSQDYWGFEFSDHLLVEVVSLISLDEDVCRSFSTWCIVQNFRYANLDISILKIFWFLLARTDAMPQKILFSFMVQPSIHTFWSGYIMPQALCQYRHNAWGMILITACSI